jgi:hypothetical protein
LDPARAREKKRTTSRFLGVSWYAKTKCWRVSIRAGKQRYSIIGVADEGQAAILRDRLALHLFGRGATLNFPGKRLKPASYEQVQRELRGVRSTSGYRGVAQDPKALRFAWCAQITIGYRQGGVARSLKRSGPAAGPGWSFPDFPDRLLM